MKELTSEMVKGYAISRGADLVGIASIDRFENAPPQMSPKEIFPRAKSVVVIAVRIPRGCYRGIHEGTYWASYMIYGYKRLNMQFRPLIVYETARFIEDHGWEAVPVPPHPPEGQPWRAPLSPDKPGPDVYPHFRLAAVAAGLGEIGLSKVFLSPQFGPRQRLGMILTDAELEPDPIFDGQICDRCALCVRECPGALSEKERVEVILEGRKLQWAQIDTGRCHLAHHGGSAETSPFFAKTFPGLIVRIRNQRMRWGGEVGKFVSMVGERIPYHRRMWRQVRGFWAFCGARGCIQACLDHLERSGRISSKFRTPLRVRKPWWM